MTGVIPRGGKGGGSSLNVPDDHRFATTAERDAAITAPKQGEQCTIQSNIPQYHLLQEYRVDKWVDITYIIEGPQGPKGDAGSATDVEVDYPITKTVQGSKVTLGAPEAITFKGGKIGEAGATLDVDIERDCAIRFVTDTPSIGYNIIDGLKDAGAPQGYFAKFGSRSLTTLLSSKGNIVSNVDGVDGVVYTSQNPQPVKLDGNQTESIRFNETGLYATYKPDTKESSIINRAPFSRTYNFNGDLTLDEPYDGITAIYTTQDPEVDHVLHFNLDTDDPRLHKDWIFTVAVDGDTASTLEVKIGKTNPKSYKVPAGFIVIELNPDPNVDEFVVHQMDTPIGIEVPAYADLKNAEWKNLPTKEYIVTEGTLGGFGTGVDGKTGRLHVNVLNNAISASDTSWFIRHEITILSDDPELSGRMFIKVAKSKDVFDAAPLLEITGGLSQVTTTTPLEAVNPVDGSTHDAVNITNNELRFGSPTIKTEIRSNQKRIPVSVQGGSDEEIAYLSDITASGGLTIDGNLTEKLISGDNLSSTYDSDSKTTTLNATGGSPSTPTDTAGFGTVNEIPERLHRFTTHEANIQASYQDDDFEVKFANGEAGPVFEVRVTEDSKSVWELGFDYTARITDFDQVLGRVLIQYEPTKSTIPAKQFFDLITLSCNKGQVKTFKKIHGDQDMAEFWIVADSNNTETRYQLSFNMSGQGEGVAEFLVKPPKFVDYVIPWDANRLPPQILLHQEGMNNQGKMGSGSNIDSSSVHQGKVYVEDFTPANGGVPGLVTEDEKKGFVLKWYGINDSESAGIFFFFNFAGDVYAKMNKNQGEKGNWEKLNNYSGPQPIVPPMIDPDNPLEIQGADGSAHDAISVTSAGKMTVGTASDQITELMISTGQPRISVNRNKSGVQTLEQLAYISDISSLQSPAIQWQSVMDASPISSGEYILKATDKASGAEVKAGDNDLLTLTYRSSSQYVYTLQLGMVRARKEHTGEDYDFYESVIKWDSVKQQYQVDVTQSTNQKALDFSINAEGKIKLEQTVINKGSRGVKTYYLRESEYIVTEEDIQNDIVIQAEPMLTDSDGIYSTTVTFPTIDLFTKYYYIPQVNEDQKDILPSIENLNIQVWLDPESTHQDTEHRLYLKSTGNSIAWGTTTSIGDYEGCFIHRPANDKSRNDFVSFNFMHIHIGGSSTGPMMGYTAQSADEDNVFSLTTTPPVKKDINNAVNLRLSTDSEGNEYVSIDRSNPVTTSEEMDNLTLIRIIGAETDSTLPIIAKVTPGELGSGFSLCEDGTSADSEILQVVSGTYTLEQMTFASTAPVGSLVYVGDNGRLTVNESNYVAGWVIDGGVIIDIDIYNASLNKSGSGNLPTDPVFNSVTTNSVKTELIETDTTKIDFDVAGGVVAQLKNDELALTKTAHSNQGMDITGIYRLIGSGETSHIALPNDNMVLYAEGLIALQDTGSDYIYFDRNLGMNFAGTSGYLCADYDGNGIYLKGRNVGFKSMDGNPVLSIGYDDGNDVSLNNHKLVNVASPTNDADAANKAYVDALEGRINTLESDLSDLVDQVSGLQTIIISQGQKLVSLEESNGNSVTNFVMYSDASDQVRMDMDRINGQGLTQTITLGDAPHPNPPEPPTPDEFTVYFGWDANSRGLIEVADIINYQVTDERTANLYVTAETLLTEVYDITRLDSSTLKYGYVAYPKGVVDPDPYKVEYSGFVASWPSREVTIDGIRYIILVSEFPNNSPNMTLKLHQ